MRRLLIFSLVVLITTLLAAPALGDGSLQAASPSPDPITTEEPVPAQSVVDLRGTSPSEAETDPVLVGGAVLFVLLLTGGLYRLVILRRPEPAGPEKVLISR